MSTRDEDELWRSIVENYGDRVVLEDEAGADSTHPRAPGAATEPGGSPSRSPLVPGPEPAPGTASTERHEGFVPFPDPSRAENPDTAAGATDDASHSTGEDGAPDGDLLDPNHRFVPPTPPLPEMDRRRWAAWIAVLGAPTAFVLAAIADISLNGLFAAVLALTFVGGFTWLVMQMPKDPGDPWDDGARV